jgi:hypothetical protein
MSGWDHYADEERAKARSRRGRVLAHPDIAKRLTEPPMRYPTPEMWTGYIPPARCGEDKPNRSPIRRQLLDTCQAVVDREREQPPLDEEAP